MSNELSKSAETLQKEEKIKALQIQLKKKHTTLKSLKTRLQNTKDDFDNIQRKVQSQLFARLDEIQELRLEIIELAKKLKSVKSISDMDRMALDEMIHDLVDGEMFGDMFHQYQEQKEQHAQHIPETEEDRRAKMEDLFAHFQVQPEEEEQRDIRKMFLGLSKIFHPDRAKNEEEAEHFHDMMQQINEAYQNNDTQTLIDLENVYLTKAASPDSEVPTSDVLQLEIDRLQRELYFIESQIERTRQEIKNLNSSELGAVKQGFKKAEKAGDSFEDMTQGFEGMIAIFSQMRDGLQDSIERGRLSPILMNMIEEDHEEEAFEEFMNMMGIDVGHMFDDDDDDDDDDDWDIEEVENPKFPLDSSVRITQSVRSPFLKKVDMKGWEGRVIDVYKENGQVIYEVEFDSITLKGMPKALVTKAFSEAEAFHCCAMQEDQLQATTPRDTEEEAFAAYRIRYHEVNWEYLPKPRQERMKKILLASPEDDDEYNWDIYLNKNLKFPFKAKTRDALGSIENIPVRVIGYAFYDEEYGHILNIEIIGEKEQRTYPLAGLKGVSSSTEASKIMEDYYEWASEMLGGLI